MKDLQWKDETIHHIVSGSSNLAPKEYKRQHDSAARAYRWDILHQQGLEIRDNWYQHQPESVVKTNSSKYYGILQWIQILKYMQKGQTS